MVAGNHVFQGINEVEAQDRTNEHRTGVPARGIMALLLHAPVKRTAGVQAVNVGDRRALLRLMHQGSVKTVTGELLAALVDPASTSHYVGKLQFGSITPGSVLIQNAGAPAAVEDDGNGLLVDLGTATQRGTINYVTGQFELTYGAAPTEPVTADYTHTDYTDFSSAPQLTAHTPPGGTGTGGTPETWSLGFGRVVPGSVSFATNGGALTFVDDGKGNIIETTGGGAVKAGTIDYAAGTITVDQASLALTAVAFNTTYAYNPFATTLVAGAASKLLDIYGSPLPELTSQVFAVGVKGESRLGLVGGCIEDGSNGTSLITMWTHFGEEPYRVEEAFSGFPPGGAVAIAGNPNG